jgi:hypothetical protein
MQDTTITSTKERGRVFLALDAAFARYWPAEGKARDGQARIEPIAQYIGIGRHRLYRCGSEGRLTPKIAAALRAAEAELAEDNNVPDGDLVLTDATIGRLMLPEGA